MKITSQVLSLPPYVSTSWKNIASLHMENLSTHEVLIITLHNGSRIIIPDLEEELLDTIFSMHAQHLEEEKPKKKDVSGHFSLELGAMDTSTSLMEGLNPLEHDPLQADTPQLPQEILGKIAEMAKLMGVGEADSFPEPQEECNCLRCQISRAIRNNLHTEELDEEVSDADLSFASWKVEKQEDQLYIVSHPLEKDEQYQVHLGNPIGCTCGDTRCEHIRAVLES